MKYTHYNPITWKADKSMTALVQQGRWIVALDKDMKTEVGVSTLFVYIMKSYSAAFVCSTVRFGVSFLGQGGEGNQFHPKNVPLSASVLAVVTNYIVNN